MTDTHTHLYMDAYEGDQAGAVERAIASGVTMMIFPDVCPESHEAMVRLHRLYPYNTRITLGLHPTEVKEDVDRVLDTMESLLDSGDYVAIGEIGIDLHWDSSTLEAQKRAFARQLEWGACRALPVIIHCRDGIDATLEVIKECKYPLPTLIFHSFTSGIEDVRRIREVCNPYFGINGVVTFKNAAELREAIPEIGIEKIVLETDAPYLAPVPHRGGRNESSYIPFIRDKIAEILNLSSEEVEQITDDNSKKIFRF